MPKAKTSSQLTKKELVFVACYVGNQVEAARLAGFKNAKKVASSIYNRPRVKAAIEKKQSALVEQSGRDLGKHITVTRNDIINGLHDLAKDAENDSTKVSAWAQLVDIFGLRARESKGDLFAGWSDEELKHFLKTQEFPGWLVGGAVSEQSPHVGPSAENGDSQNRKEPELSTDRRSALGPSESNRGASPAPARKTDPTKRS
jgi:hypothetical protein